jgi:signal transduction histidine kinase
MELATGYNLIPQLKKTRTSLIILVAISLSVFLIIQSAVINSIATESIYSKVKEVSREYDMLSLVVQEAELKIESTVYMLTFGLWLLLTLLCWILLNFILHPVSEMIIQKEQFIHNARHELRTPLAILQSEIEQLDVSKLDQKGQLEVLGINQQILRLTDLSQNLLTTLSHQKDSYSLANVDVRDVINLIDSQLKKIYSIKNISLDKSEFSIVILTNNSLFIQLITNIIENIYKHASINTLYTITYDQTSNILKFENTKDQLESTNNGVGVMASEAIAKQINFSISRRVSSNKYTTLVKLN